MPRCVCCGVEYSKEELDVEGICEKCNEDRCENCGCITDELNEDYLCSECESEGGKDYYEAKYEC